METTTKTDAINTTSNACSYSSLHQAITGIIQGSRLADAACSLAIRHAETGDLLYGKNEEDGITPASSLKILTAAAALEVLGENHRFSTAVFMDGAIEKGILHGNLYLRGQGDPTLRKSNLDNFAAALAKRGVKEISGNLIGDDTWFDADRLSPGISQEDESYYYAARISALNLSPNADFDTGSIKVDAKPSRIGQPAKVILPSSAAFMEVDNRAVTVPKNESNTLLIERETGTNKIIITGNVPLGSAGAKEWISVPDPTAYALFNFQLALAERGIAFSETSKILAGKVPPAATLLLSHESMTLKKLLVPFMKLSNNSHAEMLAKEMGKAVYGDGSWNSGLRVMRSFLEGFGLDTDQWLFEDASGMSHTNKITAAELSKLLYKVRFRPWFSHFLNGLPVAGAPERFIGGTLRKRFKTGSAKNNATAKTGTLNGVSSLSGYVKTKDGEWLVIAFLTQGFAAPTIPAIDRLVEAIAQSRQTF
ncbi:D-alanyl-D-alanine carboxypeptidase/D-alanyl-D-alanine-endopeptidase [Planomicrobium sp. CPCC 101079]|uniref:D-alanyl-D-alanine carboxypeptidase/D-alanyl-D-alanine endopeptidase n=1 Tax=Planomicrobium sp. CPCC 101079 TaxID=2599618 RepID=UPI0011B553B5|nr:D-alanyl-D-alanine carboxypeptidase/D-alanyl-D-alanine-endopeptidase [Planomicrobium sp. CPCC 101079]TWT16029.1 D-alanyl-D-alanine carboxypeptidase/D-alanyl-D-alanine-endopeptidase [Planomicrobium sp. CPCC 101079]